MHQESSPEWYTLCLLARKNGCRMDILNTELQCYYLWNTYLKFFQMFKEAKWESHVFRKTDFVTKWSTDCAAESWIEGCISAQLLKNITCKSCSYVYPDIAFLYCFICLLIWLPLKLRMDHLLKAKLYLAWFVNQYPSSSSLALGCIPSTC